MQTLQTLANQQPLDVVLRSVIDTMELMPHFKKESKSDTAFEDRMQNVKVIQQTTQKYTDRVPCLVKSKQAPDGQSTHGSRDARVAAASFHGRCGACDRSGGTVVRRWAIFGESHDHSRQQKAGNSTPSL